MSDTLEMLFMPGPVIAGHAEYEEQCALCHSSFRKDAQDLLCLDCHEHEAVASDIKNSEGFHGRLESIGEVRCNRCHTDHKGRNTNILALEKEHFEHDNTDFRLREAHALAPCAGCHVQGKKYRDAPSNCVDCHREHDQHSGRLGAECGECHNEANWATTSFDHDLTNFPLIGAHPKLACGVCHPDERYEATPGECVSCHRVDDVHGERHSGNCAKCHSQGDWKTLLFEHDTDTGFKLSGAHKGLACDACHTGQLYDQKLDGDCLDCHKDDDEHTERNGEECSKCHGTDEWSEVSFDHDEATKFPLRGKHMNVACQDCHRGEVFLDQLDTGCWTKPLRGEKPRRPIEFRMYPHALAHEGSFRQES